MAEHRDAGAVADIWNGMIRDTLATFTTVEKATGDVAARISQAPTRFWVWDDGGVTGFVTYGSFRAGPGYAATVEHSVILSPDAQGRGIGRALMNAAMSGAAQEGHRVMVAAISSANPGAVAFHMALDFKQTGHLPEVGRKAGQWLDLIVMQKTLVRP